MFGDDLKRALTTARAEAHRLGHAALAIHDLPYADSSRTLIELMVMEARALGHAEVGSDHLFLGLLQLEGSLPRAVFSEHGVTVDAARALVVASRERAAG